MGDARRDDLVLCAGRDCRQARGYGRLRELAEATPGSTLVDCQGVCSAPMVGLERRGVVRWYRKVRGARRRQLVEVLSTGRGRSQLREAEVRRRRGVVRRARRRRPVTTGDVRG